MFICLVFLFCFLSRLVCCSSSFPGEAQSAAAAVAAAAAAAAAATAAPGQQQQQQPPFFGQGGGGFGGDGRVGERNVLDRRDNMQLDDPEAFARPEGLLLGKDRELFHASIDLKKVWNKATNKETWLSLFQRMIKTLSQITGADDHQLVFKEIAIEMLCDIRKHNKDSTIKLFQGTIKQAETYARRLGRFIVVYVEEESGGPGASMSSIDREGGISQRISKGSLQYRLAFADPTLGNMLNDNFVFFAGSTRHSPTYKMAKLLGARKGEYPMLAILSPAYVEPPGEKKRVLPEMLATLRLAPSETNAAKVTKFLQRVLDVHLPLLNARKKEYEDLLLAETNLAEMSEIKRISDEAIQVENRRKQALLRLLPTEPLVDSRNVVLVSLKNSLTGKTLERRFSQDVPAATIVRWADAEGFVSPGGRESLFELKCSQAPLIFNNENAKKTLKDLGIKQELSVVCSRSTSSKN